MKDKIIIITGASGGIGKEMVVTFSKLEAKVVAVSRSKDKLEKMAEELHRDCMVYAADIRDEDSVRNLMEAVFEKYGRIDVLINNAGYVEPAGLMDITLKQWNETVDTNLTGTFICTKQAVRFMKKQGGKIINIASTSGLSPRAGWSAYAASKAGVINFSLTMADELRTYNIKVFCICPGRTATDLRKKLVPNEDPHSIMQPRAVVEVVKYCLCEESDVLEGQPILVRERE